MNTLKTLLTHEIQQANLFKLLTHPVRIAILQILRHGEACVCHIEATLGYRQAYLSQQLAILRSGGIITDRRDGWNIYYQIEDQRILELIDIVGRMLPVEKSHIPAQPVACPCPNCITIAKKCSCSETKKEEGECTCKL
jgi:ArsR family transcriptional regulator